MNEHEKYMRRCIELAMNGTGGVAPNPMVGCVIVHKNRIIGEGFHRKYGGSHAEVNALDSVRDKLLLSESTVYVNLEPCAHYGKTPPCTDILIKHKVPEVIIGCMDPYSEVSGKGVEILRSTGCNVVLGVLEKEAKAVNKRFFTFHEKKRPFIIFKWAQTADGFMDKSRMPGNTVDPNRISSDISQVLVHKWRSEEQAIMVGTNTALNDNPRLNVREWSGSQPLRVVIDKSLRLPLELHLFDGSLPTLVFTAENNGSNPNPEYLRINFKEMPEAVCRELYNRKIQSVLIEGGQALLNTFISCGLWDEAKIIISPIVYKSGLKAPVLNNAIQVSKDNFGPDFLFCYKNNRNL